MPDQPSPLEVALPQVSLLMEEIPIIAQQLYESLESCLQLTRSGRAPRALGLESHLAEPQEYLTTLQDMLQELAQALPSLGTEENQTLVERLEQENAFWKTFASAAQTFLQRLELMSEATEWSALGQMPIEEAWTTLEQIAAK